MKGKFIYKIINTVNGKFYVGSTTNHYERFRIHRQKLRSSKHHCKHLQASWNKYGENSFVFAVIENLGEDCDLMAAEERWLREHVGKEYCYNSGLSANAPMRGIQKEKHPNFGKPISDEQREAISQKLKEFYAADPANHPRYGKCHTPETIEKIKLSRKGKMAGENHYRYGKILSDEVKQKISAAQKGVKRGPKIITEEGRRRIAEAAARGSYSHQKGKKRPQEIIDKIKKKIRALPEDIVFNSVNEALAYYNIKSPTLNRSIKTGKPIKKGRLTGVSFQYA
jgi:group I intron endonuclease